MKKITLILFIIILIFTFNKKLEASTEKNLVNIYFFYSNTCSHCKEEKKFLTTLTKKYNNINLYKYEIHDNKNKKLIEEVEKIYNIKINGVPFTIIGTKSYIGYSNKDNLKFIKTIEYYSSYGYEDELGKYLNESLPNYKIKKNQISLETFINTYHNYKLLGLKTDNIDIITTSIILGLLLSINIISVISSIIITIIANQYKKEKKSLLSIGLYLILSLLLLIISLIKNKYLLYVYIIILLCILITKLINNQKDYKHIFIVLIAIINNYLLTYKFNENIKILKSLKELNIINGLNKLYYYFNYIIIYILITSLIILLIYKSINKIRDKKSLNNN